MTRHSPRPAADGAQDHGPASTRRTVVRTLAGGALTAATAGVASGTDAVGRQNEAADDGVAVQSPDSPIYRDLGVSVARDAVAPGETVTADIFVDFEPARELLGIGLDVTVDPNVARIADATLDFELATVEVADDGRSVSLVGTDTAGEYQSVRRERVGALQLEGVEHGYTALSPEPYENGVEVGSYDDSEVLDVDPVSDELAVRPECVDVGDETACDLEGDLRLRDFTGDGELGTDDVATFHRHLFTDGVQDRPQHFDFSGNGAVSHGDAIALFREATEL